MALVVYPISQVLVTDLGTLLIAVTIGGVIYISLILIIAKNKLISEFKGLKYAFFNS